MNRKAPQNKGIVQFNTPVSGIVDGRKAASQQRMSDIKQPRQPLGGAPEVRIPPLNAEALESGGTMQDQAEILRDPTNPMSPAYNPQLAQMAKSGQLGNQPTVNVPQQAFQTLPQGSQEDPRFRPGVGSMIAANQPQLQQTQPQPPGSSDSDGYKPTLSPQSLASMKALEEFQLQAKNNQETKTAPVEPTETSPAAKQAKQDIEDESAMMDDFKGMMSDDTVWDKMNNPDRKKRIEAKLKPMEFTDIIVHGEVRQDVPIRKGLILTYRTASGAEDLEVKRLMFNESGSDRYMVDKYSVMQMTLALVGINGQELPSHLTSEKKFDEEKYAVKFDKVLKFPIEFIAEVGLQYLWFHERVRDLFSDDMGKIKNG